MLYSFRPMPWQEIKAIEQRMNFVDDVESSAESFSDLCAGYGVSRVTGYKWRERYEEEGLEGLWERSRAPHGVGHALREDMIKRIVEGRGAHPKWGPRKLLAWLKADNYKKMFLPEPTIHLSSGPHGGFIRSYYNPILVEDLRAGKSVWRAGATMVKELYFNGTDQVRGYSVMVKLDDDSGPHGEGWQRTPDRAGAGRDVGSGAFAGFFPDGN